MKVFLAGATGVITALRSLGWRFNADRMVMDYVQTSYLPASGGLSCAVPQS